MNETARVKEKKRNEAPMIGLLLLPWLYFFVGGWWGRTKGPHGGRCPVAFLALLVCSRPSRSKSARDERATRNTQKAGPGHGRTRAGRRGLLFTITCMLDRSVVTRSDSWLQRIYLYSCPLPSNPFPTHTRCPVHPSVPNPFSPLYTTATRPAAPRQARAGRTGAEPTAPPPSIPSAAGSP